MSFPDDGYLQALGRERAQYALSPKHFGRVMMVDAHLQELGYGADDEGTIKKLPPVERAEAKAPEDATPKRRGRPPRERAVDPAPETAVDDE